METLANNANWFPFNPKTILFRGDISTCFYRLRFRNAGDNSRFKKLKAFKKFFCGEGCRVENLQPGFSDNNNYFAGLGFDEL